MKNNQYWTTYVQTSEELYRSRATRFRDDNADLWLNLLQVENGQDILEIGCGGGIFTHQIKKHLPETRVTGMDFDINHIKYATQKAKELGIDCTFVEGDAENLPFADNSFDLCFSYTVFNFIEPNAFAKEQFRVLKPGGKAVIVTAYSLPHKQMEDWVPDENCEEKELFEKIWAQAVKSELNVSDTKRHSDLTEYIAFLENHGFSNIFVDSLSAVAYCPDSANFTQEQAIMQINDNRIAEMSSVLKARNLAPNALSEVEFTQLIDMINRRWDKRIEQYNSGEKSWDWRVSAALAIIGTKKT